MIKKEKVIEVVCDELSSSLALIQEAGLSKRHINDKSMLAVALIEYSGISQHDASEVCCMGTNSVQRAMARHRGAILRAGEYKNIYESIKRRLEDERTRV